MDTLDLSQISDRLNPEANECTENYRYQASPHTSESGVVAQDYVKLSKYRNCTIVEAVPLQCGEIDFPGFGDTGGNLENTVVSATSTTPISSRSNSRNPQRRYSTYLNPSIDYDTDFAPGGGTYSNINNRGSSSVSGNPDINVPRPTSATPVSSLNNSRKSQRRYSTYVNPSIDYDNVFALGVGLCPDTIDRRSSSVSVIPTAGKCLAPVSKDSEFVVQPTPQSLRTRRISFGLGGVPKSGYWGGGGSVGDDKSDSEDSLLDPTSRRHSKIFQVRGPTLMGYNRRQWHYLIVFAIVDFCSAIVISLQGPIYPLEYTSIYSHGTLKTSSYVLGLSAEQKQITAAEYGFVFGIFELTILIMCPIFGKLLGKISPQFMFNGGIFTSGACVIFFGFLADVDDPATFLTLSFILRIIEAAGDAACMTAAYAIITAECPDTVSTTFIFLKTFFGIGVIIGPLLGGTLYSLGGFLLPFVVLGGLLFSSALFTLYLIPKQTSIVETSGDATSSDKNAKGTTGIKLLQSPTIALAAFSIVASSISIGFLNATLEPHIRELTASSTTVGAIFIINGGAYSISSPAWGWGCHIVSDPKYITLTGALLTFVAFLFIGPAPFIPVNTCLWLTCLGLLIQGIGIGAIFVSGFLLTLRDTVDKGYPDNESTYGLVSGLYTSLFTVGNCIGPSISGVLVDYVGFRWATIFVLALQALLIFFVVSSLIYDEIIKRTRVSSEFDDESYSALQVSGSHDEWDDSNKDNLPKSYGTIISNSV